MRRIEVILSDNLPSIQIPVTFAVENRMWQFICKGAICEKDFGSGSAVRFGVERGSSAEVDGGRRDLPVSDLFQVV
jgi:hypothetical protein